MRWSKKRKKGLTSHYVHRHVHLIVFILWCSSHLYKRNFSTLIVCFVPPFIIHRSCSWRLFVIFCHHCLIIHTYIFIFCYYVILKTHVVYSQYPRCAFQIICYILSNRYWSSIVIDCFAMVFLEIRFFHWTTFFQTRFFHITFKITCNHCLNHVSDYIIFSMRSHFF